MDFLIQSDAFVKPKEIWKKLFFVFQHGVFSLNQWTSPGAQIGLWTLSPPSSAVFPHPEPAIYFFLLVSGFPP